ncbi:uracil-DNA glycosylase [Candidatus Woesearchaeota archaeon]|nr:uracil-DNA glycosylase [Candidatus Woesearchaeota archaeon]
MTCEWFESCPLRRLEREGKIKEKWKNNYCDTEDNFKNCIRYKMVERGEAHPDNLMPDGTKIDVS